MHDIERLFAKHRLTGGVICIGVGAVALIAGYFGVSGTRVVSDQLSYLVSGGLGGVALVIVGTGLVTVDYFARLELTILGQRASSETARQSEPLAPPASAGTDEMTALSAVTAIPGAKKFHDLGCAVCAGRSDTVVVSVDQAFVDGLRPCALCLDPQRLPDYMTFGGALNGASMDSSGVGPVE